MSAIFAMRHKSALPCSALSAGGYGERVTNPAALPAALARAMDVMQNQKRQALLNVICSPGGGA
jgi:acetolactate synthase-1/2/3 large subunit